MKVGYHIADIKRGTLGEPSKIKEELEEFLDAHDQCCLVMSLLELSDMVGAIRAYLDKYAPSVHIEDLERMSRITERAFKNGHRG